MDLVAASWCKQFNVISFLLLLQSATTLSLSCPAKCECTNFRDASFVECYNVSTLKTIPSGIPANARTLVFQHTQISKIQQNAFQGLPHVIEIEIQFNPLTTIERNAFQGLTKLNELVLKGNNINLLYRDSFRGIPQIRKIFLSKNNLQTLPEGLFDNTTNLELLRLGNNKITSIPSTLLARHRQLADLELQNNQLSEFPLELLKNLTNLSILLLDNNLFTTIPYEAKEVLDKIAQKQHSTIGLSRNPLMCTQELKWLQTWIKLHPSVVEVDKVMCQTPFGNWSKVVTFNFSLLETNLWPTPGKINEHMTSPTPSLQTTYTSAFIELPVTSSAASLASAVVTSSIPSSPTSSPSLTTSSVTSSGKSNTITPTSSSTSNSASSTAVVTSPPETTETPNTSKKTDDVTTIFTTLESTEKSIPPETSDTVTAGSKVDVSTTSIEKESASKGKYLSRNQQVILSASLVSVCLIATVALAMYFFRKKVILRQKTINARLPGMMYDRVNTVSVVE
ncbi:SLIT and NTRK-like protein 4 isoform X1 [Stylophora pistillata]|uniref:SLIT and NTRK-like protein 4 isoform X1 n=1 Tax=Stylophora pistillata TaxID=50429 RepID=UPI000C04CD03|nr:SLIT and NTRK-like protein 4 isoform X1 [Stylophora pistillata]